jgi:sulfite exporter TauE/SafE
MNPELRVIVARLAGVLAGAIASYLASRGINVASQDISTVIIELTSVFLTIYGLVHTATNARINPTAAASPTIAQEVHLELKSAKKTEADHGGLG